MKGCSALLLALVGLMAMALAPSCICVEEALVEGKGQGELLAYVSGKGIHVYSFDLATGAMKPRSVEADVRASFFDIHPDGAHLYAVGGGVSAFSIDPETGALTFLNRKPSGGKGPCHIVVDARGRSVLVAHYSDGSVAALGLHGDGRLGELTASVKHTGSSVNPQRQKGPHAHSINLDPANRFAVAADLGLDKVLVYRFDAATGALVANDPPSVSVKPGAGPRHFNFHPDGRHGYVINELDSTVTAFTYDAARGVLNPIQTVSTIPAGHTGENYTAEVLVHPSGKFLYGSNRGHHSIAVFTIDAGSGKLTFVETEPTQGEWPRNFRIDPTGAYLLAANQRSDTVVVLRIDPKTGALEPTGHTISVPGPSCIKFLRR